nr:InlB B-repeat-containing protein [uncultured Sphaerochaeta sp.]
MKRSLLYTIPLLILFTLVSMIGCDMAGPEIEEKVSVTFYTDDIMQIKSVTVGERVTAPSAPTKTGHTFAGWYTDQSYANAWNFSTAITTDIILYAKWTPSSLDITYDYNSAQQNTTVQANYDTQLTAPAAPNANGSKIFSGWYKDSAFTYRWDFSTDVVHEDMTLYAQWLTDPVDITFDSNGGSFVNGVAVEKGATLTAPTAPTRDWYTFSGWYSDAGLSTAWNFSNPVNADMTLYAKWTSNTVKGVFDSNGGSNVLEQTILKGSTFTKPSDPEKEGYTFAGWFSDTGLTTAWDFNTDVSADTTLYAKWTEIFATHVRDYRVATLTDVPLETGVDIDPYTLPGFNDESFMAFLQGTLNSGFGGTITAFTETIKGNAHPTTRALSSTFSISLEDENLSIVQPGETEGTYDTLLDFTIDHLDLEMKAKVSDLLELLETAADMPLTNENKPDFDAISDIIGDIFAEGNFGVSSFMSIEESNGIKLATGLFIDFGIKNLQYQIPSTDNPLWIDGDVYISLQFSIATNTIGVAGESDVTVYDHPVVIEFALKPIKATRLDDIDTYLEDLSSIFANQNSFGTAMAAFYGSYDVSEEYMKLSITDGTTAHSLTNWELVEYIGGLIAEMS